MKEKVGGLKRDLNEQVAYKRGVAGPKKWRPELIIVKMAV